MYGSLNTHLERVFSVIWSFLKRQQQKGPSLSEFDKLIIQADKTMSEGDRQKLYTAIDRKGYSGDQYAAYRTSLYVRLAKSGDAFAQCQLGDIAHIQEKANEALHWYTLSAQGGCSDAMYSMGLYYSKFSNGEYSSYGFGYDPLKSFHYYLQAAQNGHLKAMAAVARCYADGEGVDTDLDKALEWAQRGANLGGWDCCYYLANSIYNDMCHPLYDQAKALQWYGKSVAYADRDQFERTVRSMGYIYGAAYLYNSPETPISDRRKAAYCFTMAYITNHDDDSDKKLYQKTGYRISDQEFSKLRDDTINRRLSF